jgi:hypothetical protein
MSFEASLCAKVFLLHSFMLRDIGGSLVATIAFAALLYCPGYVIAYAADLFSFRSMDLRERSMWAIACSFCTVPVVAYLVARVGGLGADCWVAIAATAATAMLLAKRDVSGPLQRYDRRLALLVALGWIAFCLLMLVDFQWGHKLFFSVVTADQSYRVAFTNAVVRTGVPPSNPLYFPGSVAPMRYYYFWYLLSAVVVKLAHVSARDAFIASTIWAGFGLIVTVCLYTRHFFHWERRRRWIALGLLLITGADLIPSLGNAILQSSLNGDIEWWSVEPIDAWPDSLLWVPHHVAAVLCCLLGFLLLWRTYHAIDRKHRRMAITLTAFAFASAFGLSVYVAIGFAMLMIVWLFRPATLRSRERNTIWRSVVLATLLACVLGGPFIYELAGVFHHDETVTKVAAASTTEPTHILSIRVRNMIDSGLLTGLPVFASWNKSHPLLLEQTIRLVLLLPGLALELGLYGAVLVLLLRLKRSPSGDIDAWDTSLYLTVAGLVISCFISSSIISNNDFGYRVVMLPQFFLMLLTADVLGSWLKREKAPRLTQTPFRRGLLYGLLGLGAAGTIYGAFLLRAWLPMEVLRPQNGFSNLPEEAYQIRTAFAALDRESSAKAVVSFRPIDPTPDRKDEVMAPNEFYQRMIVMNAGRQFLNAEGKCATQFGGSAAPCADIQHETAALYTMPAPDADAARAYCIHFGVQYLAISNYDPDWKSTSGWPVTLPSVDSEPSFRILSCGMAEQK